MTGPGVLRKVRHKDGRREIWLFRWRIASYRLRKSRCSVTGENNVIEGLPAQVEARVYGSRNAIRFAGGGRFEGSVQIGAPDHPVSGCALTVGAGTTSNGCRILMMENDTQVTIGEDCMISWDVDLLASDTHAILEDGQVVNRATSVRIGDHVWLGARAVVLKNSDIASGCVVGCGSVLAGLTVREEGSVIAGNPARVVKTGVSWSRARPDACGGGSAP